MKRALLVSFVLAAVAAFVACSSGDETSATATATASGTATASASATGSGAASASGSGGAGGVGGANNFGGNPTGGIGSGGAPGGMPITAPNETWTWVDFPDSMCANGTTTGIGINITNKSDKVLVYFEGGGACWDESTCYSLMTAANITTGYGATEFASDESSLLDTTELFSHTSATNPFADYSYVYVPYCTGDVHAGDMDATYGTHPTHHHGVKNTLAYLNRLVPTFPNASQVVWAGSSAGGFGAALNYWRAELAWGSGTKVYLVDDSGPPMSSMYITLQSTWIAAWNLSASIPSTCATCTTDFEELISFYAKNVPGRAALLSYTQDTVIPTYFFIPLSEFQMGLDEVATRLDATSTFKYFYKDAASHVLLGDLDLATNGVTLREFLKKMVTDDPAWASEKP